MWQDHLNDAVTFFFKEKGTVLTFLLHGVYLSKDQKNHHTADPQDNLTIDELRHVIDYFLSQNYLFVSTGELTSNLERNKKYVMLTFDDGYYSNSYTLPLLEEYQIPATYFISTYNLKEQKGFWWDIVYRERHKQGSTLLNIRNEQHQLKDLQYESIEKYLISQFGIKSLDPVSDIDRPFTMEELFHFSENKYVTIGNHSHHHALLTTYDQNGILHQLQTSQEILSNLVGYYPTSIAYPNGAYNREVIDSCIKLGFKTGITVNETKNYLPKVKQHLLLVNRFILKNRDIKQLGHFYRRNFQWKKKYKTLKRKVKKLLLSGS